MRDCIERGKGGGTSMGKLVGNEAKLLNDAFLAGRTFMDPLTVKAEIYALSVMGENSRMGVIVAAPTAGAGGVGVVAGESDPPSQATMASITRNATTAVGTRLTQPSFTPAEMLGVCVSA